MKKVLSAILAVTLVMGLLVGCGGSSNSGNSGNAGGAGDSSTTTTAAAAGGDASSESMGGQVITIGISSDITSLDPHNHNDTASAYATRHIYSNLVRLTEDNEFVGDLS